MPLQPMTFLTTSSSRFGSKGLTSHPVAPAARPWAFMTSLDSVVSIRIASFCNVQNPQRLDRARRHTRMLTSSGQADVMARRLVESVPAIDCFNDSYPRLSGKETI